MRSTLLGNTYIEARNHAAIDLYRTPNRSGFAPYQALYAHPRGRPIIAPAQRKKEYAMKRIVGLLRVFSGLTAVLLLCPLTARSASPPSSYYIYLSDGHGGYVDRTSTSSYQNPFVFDLATQAVIGNVPGPGLQIYDNNAVQIGYLSL